MAKVPRVMSKDAALLEEEITAESVGKSDCSMAVFLVQGERNPSTQVSCQSQGTVLTEDIKELCKASFQSCATLGSPVPVVNLTLWDHSSWWDLEKLPPLRLAVFSQHTVHNLASLHRDFPQLS